MRYITAIIVSAITIQAAVSFQHEVLPVLTRQGCNAGTCHGSPSGKGGFALSLFAFDAKSDHTVLTKDYLSRRVDLNDPALSLLLRKPSNAISHRGGLKLPQSSHEYKILHDWIKEGCLDDTEGGTSCTGIELQPEGSTLLHWPNPISRLRVKAYFSDGTARDITHLVQFTSSDEAIAVVKANGVVAGVNRGVAAVMVRYLEHVRAVAFTFVKPMDGFQWTNLPAANYVDIHVHAKLKQMQFTPSGLCTDAEFVRRVYLDVLGRLPSPHESRTFFAGNNPDKRKTLIDQLLQRPEYALFWAQKWGDLLRLDPQQVSATGTHKFHRWLVQAYEKNLPYDEFTRELLTASGSTFKKLRAPVIGSGPSRTASASRASCSGTLSMIQLFQSESWLTRSRSTGTSKCAWMKNRRPVASAVGRWLNTVDVPLPPHSGCRFSSVVRPTISSVFSVRPAGRGGPSQFSLSCSSR